MKIGNIETGILALGPMAGITDLPFRLLCREQGADLIYSEMVSAKGIHYNNPNSDLLLRTDPAEQPTGLQLFGSEADIMVEAALRTEPLGFTFFDINMGCPVPKVVRNGEGSALMKTPELAADIVRSMAGSLHKPVTVKIRSGFTADTVNAPELAARLEAAGAAAITVHARTREQYYSGSADWKVIKEVRKAVSIPVIGNGDIHNFDDARRMMDETGCDAVMIARAARGNPWIFREVKAGLEGRPIPPRPEFDEVLDMIDRHRKMLADFKGPETANKEMRAHIAWYTQGLPHSARLRSLINTSDSPEQVDELLAAYRAGKAI